MKSIVFVDTYYFKALEELALVQRFPNNSKITYEGLLSKTADFGFGTGASYQRAFKKLGWETHLIVPNALSLQDAWALENNHTRPIPFGWQRVGVASRVPILRTLLTYVPHAYQLLLKQIKSVRPNVVVIQDINFLPPAIVEEIKKIADLVVGEIASPLPPSQFLSPFDRIFSALPTIVEIAQRQGISSSFLPLAFDVKWASHAAHSERENDVVFIGSFTRLQPTTAPLLRAIGKVVPSLKIYGMAADGVIKKSELENYYHGPAWGAEMFRILGNSRVVINRHGTVAGDFAVNMRMYESTGMGAALVTEQKGNLSTLFSPGAEVLSYSSVNDAAQQVLRLVDDLGLSEKIGFAGQRKTLREHTYDHRAETMSEILERDLLHR